MNLPPAKKLFGIYREAFSLAVVPSGIRNVVLSKTSIKLIAVRAGVTWTVQPNPLQIWIVVDDIDSAFSFANPVSAAWYYFQGWDLSRALVSQVLGGTPTVMNYVGQIASGNIKIEVESTGGTVNPLQCEAIYQKLV